MFTTSVLLFQRYNNILQHTFKLSSAIDTRPEDIESFVECLESQLIILDSTVSQRHEFNTIVQSYDKLRLIMLPKWAGLGAIQYVHTTTGRGLVIGVGWTRWFGSRIIMDC